MKFNSVFRRPFLTLLYCIFFILIYGCKPGEFQLLYPTPVETAMSESGGESLPFLLIYGGVQIRNALWLIDNTPFTHIALGSSTKEINLRMLPKQRAILWTGIAQGDPNSPWATLKSPWGNELENFCPRWKRRMTSFAQAYGESKFEPKADFVVLDIEAELYGKQVDELQSENVISEELKRLSFYQFRRVYESALLDLSKESVLFAKRSMSPATRYYSSYGDVPISRVWYEIPKHSWNEWTNNRSLTNFMGLEGVGVMNPFAKELNIMTPSAYYFFPTGQNLAYLLFQIEANKAWTNKKLVVFVTPRYTGKQTYGRPIEESLAEATAIFPFFAGANGFWLWETSKDRLKVDDFDMAPPYRGFARGIKRLSEYADYFDGQGDLFIPKTGHALFIEKKPIWRIIVRRNKALLVAQNPYAKFGEETILSVQYKNWKNNIKLTGTQIHLEEYSLE